MPSDLEILTIKDKQKWRELVESSLYRDIHQLPEYIEPFEEHICVKGLLARYQESGSEVLFPFFLRNIPYAGSETDGMTSKDIISPWYYGGPFYIGQIDDKIMRNFKESLMDYCKRNGVVTIFSRFNPYLGNHTKTIGNLNIRKINTIVWVDLTDSIENIWARSISKECRRKIRISKKKGIEVRISSDKKDLRSFHELYIKEMRMKNAEKFYMFSLDFLNQLHDNLEDNLVITSAEYNGNLVAASIWVYKYNVMYGLLGARNFDFPHENSSSSEIYEIMKFAKDRGVRIIDLGGGMVKNPGLMKYKETFSKNKLSLYGQNTIIDFDRYKSICSQFGLDGHQLSYENSDYFPEYRYDVCMSSGNE